MASAPWILALAVVASPVRVGSKDFTESRLLGEIFAQLLEARGVLVERRFGLAGTTPAFDALRQGSLDLYPEYDGTAFRVLLHAPPPEQGAAAALGAALARLGLVWLPSLGFSNGWVLAIPRTLAARERLQTLDDLARVAPTLRAGLSPEFLGRPDGLPGLARAYGLRFAEALPMAQPLKYGAMARGEIQVIDAYATDGRLETANLVPLRDDRSFFPDYEASPLCRADLFYRSPEAGAALLALAGRLDAGSMRRLNREVEGGQTPARVAANWLARQRLTDSIPAAPGTAQETALVFAWRRAPMLLRLVRRHLALALGGVLLAFAVALPMGLAAGRSHPLGAVILGSVAVIQTIPGLALLAFLVPWFGIGAWPALVALFLYALLPLVQAFHAGLGGLDPELVQVARGLGMTEGRIALRLRLPLATPVILSGLRTATVISLGTATLAAFVGGGGLGEPILEGLALDDPRLILFGAIPAALLALGADAALALLGRAVAPRL